MKTLLILLIFTLLSYNSYTQPNEENSTTNASSNSTEAASKQYISIDQESVENNMFILHLINYGTQVVIGRVSDSQLVSYHTGNYTNIYDVAYYGDDILNFDVNLLSYTYDGSQIHATFNVYYDKINGLMKLTSYSYEVQNYTKSGPAGINISYSAEEDVYEVIKFNGFAETLYYQSENVETEGATYAGDDFLPQFTNWTSVNTSAIQDNQTLQNSLNAALRDLRSLSEYSGFLDPNYDELNISEIHSIDIYWAKGVGNYVRFDFDFQTANQSGRLVSVTLCPVYTEYPPFWPPYWPKEPMKFAGDGIVSTIATEGSQDYGEGMEEGSSGSPEGDGSGDFGSSSGSIITGNPNQYYFATCLYGTLDYHYFIEFKDDA